MIKLNVSTNGGYMNFKNIEAADRSLFIRYLDGEKRRLCEYCFTDLYMWKDLYNTEWCLENDILYIRQSLDKEGKFFYYYPPLPTKSKLVYGVKNIIIDSVIEGYEFSIGGVNLEVLADIGRYYKGAFHAEINRDYADYIYLASDLINLSGRKFHKKKNLINKFKKEYDGRWSYKNIELSDIDLLRKFNKKWIKANVDKDINELKGEEIAINRAFDEYNTLKLDGGMILLDGEIIAYSFGTKIRDDMYVIQVEKALSHIPGSYQMINNEYAKAYCSDIKYINREDDVGIEGLRRAKMSYNPVRIEDFYEIKLKRKIDSVKIFNYRDGVCSYE